MFARALRIRPLTIAALLLELAALLPAASAQAQRSLPPQDFTLTPLGSYETGVFDEGAAEIVAFDSQTDRLFVVNGDANAVDVLDASDPSNPTKLFAIDLSPYGDAPNSVAVYRGLVGVAVQIENSQGQQPGKAVFFDADGTYLYDATVGALPDMITFSPNGQYALVANEGEPNDDYSFDPEGSVSIIRFHRRGRIANVCTADFRAFNLGNLDPGVRIFGPGASVAQDLEPEYIGVDRFSRKAYVGLQENNAIAVVDIAFCRVDDIFALGTKDHSLAMNALDASDRDDAINIASWPVMGMYQPDALAIYSVPGQDYIVTANEGDSRDYDGFSEEARVKDLDLDPASFPNAAELQEDEKLGRLEVTTANGDIDGDGLYEQIYNYGARSMSIWDRTGNLVYDGGDELERFLAQELPDEFNSTNDENGSFDSRSDAKGPEPEGVALGRFRGRTLAFLGLERIGGVVIYDITIPSQSRIAGYVNTRDFSGDAEAGTAGDLAPEGLAYIDERQSPTGRPMLAVAYEVSGTTTLYELDVAR